MIGSIFACHTSPFRVQRCVKRTLFASGSRICPLPNIHTYVSTFYMDREHTGNLLAATIIQKFNTRNIHFLCLQDKLQFC